MLIQTKIIKALEKELERARTIEETSRDQAKMWHDKDQGFTNGILRAIDTVRRVK